MNKQELIEKMKANGEWFETNRYVKITKVIELINQMDEPQKVKVPAFVAPFIEKLKITNRRYGVELEKAYNNEEDEELVNWLWFNENVLTLFRALEKGYEVEEEPKYRVKIGNGYFVNYQGRGCLISPHEKDGIMNFDSMKEANRTADTVGGTVEKV